jgi:hypothetical protein
MSVCLQHALGITVAPTKCTSTKSRQADPHLYRPPWAGRICAKNCLAWIYPSGSKPRTGARWVVEPEQLTYTVRWRMPLWAKLGSFVAARSRLDLAEACLPSCRPAVSSMLGWDAPGILPIDTSQRKG